MAVLLFHGVGETISDWVGAQRYLREACVSSLVFDYTGSGDSSRPARHDDINADAIAAYAFFLGRAASADCVFTLGHSMGNGHMLAAAPHWSRQPDGVIVANAFASMRAFVSDVPGWGVLAPVMPDWWNNVEAVSAVRAPLLVIHSEADGVNPLADGERIFAAASEPKIFVQLSRSTHNALHQEPTEEFWSPVLDFMRTRCASGQAQ